MSLFTTITTKIGTIIKPHLDYTGERVVPTEMHGDPTTWIEHLSRYLFALKFVVKKKTLDIACGTGYGTALLSSLASSITGIDIDEETIKWAKKNNIFYCPVSFLVKDVESEKIEEKFDTIVCFETIEHLKNPKRFLIMLATLTKRNGNIIFSVPLKSPPNKFHKHRFKWSSIAKITAKTLGKNIRWFSQFEQNIFPGQDPNAKFAIGIWSKE